MDNNSNNYYNNMNGVNPNNVNNSNNYNTVNSVNQNGLNNSNQNTIISEPPITLDSLEKTRVKAKNQLIRNLSIFLSIAVIAYIISYLGFESDLQVLFVFLIFGFAIAYALSHRSIKNYKDDYKKYFVVSVFEKKCNNVFFDLDRGINKEVIANTNMMYMGDRFSSNDYVSAQYKGVNFEYSDVHIEEEYKDNDGNTHYQTLFRGQWFIFDFNKNFKSNLQICESNFRNAKRNSWFGSDRYRKVSLEDIDFNKTFRVFAQNNLEAFYILTPHMIERIKTLNNNMHGSLLFCFIDNRLHVGLHSSKDSFEANIFKKINEAEEQSKANMEIDTILNFIDVLNLDNTLFK